MTRASGRCHRNRDRGQTQQDFALGIGLFLVTIVFVFAFVPAAFDFSTPSAGSQELQQAQRSSTTLLDEFTAGERQNEVNATTAAEYFAAVSNLSALRAELALARPTRINVSIRRYNGSVVSADNRSGTTVSLMSGPREPGKRPTAEVVRIVSVAEQDVDCTPACRLVVTTW